MKKRILSFVLTLALCLGLLPVAVSAADSDFVVQDIDVEGKHFTNVLTAYNGPGGDVVIPNGVRYVGLGIGWFGETYGSVFAGRTDITSVSIPEGAVAIGGNVFAGCTGLTSVTIPNSMREITNHAFAGCSSLTSVTIPSSVQRITTGAFAGCTGLTSLTLCEGVGSIGGEAFMGCTGLTSVSIPGSATVESRAFQDCTNLTNVTISSTAHILGNPFDGTAWQKKQGDWLIINNTLLEYTGKDLDVVIPNHVTTLGSYWYKGDWDTVRSITIPNSVTKIGDSAFNGGFSGPWGFIHTVNIPNSVTEIGVGAFSHSDLASLELPNSVTTIGIAAFSDCQYLTSIIIPDSVTSIGDRAFDRSSKVTIHGTAGSYAETYAKENHIPFVADVVPKVGGFNDVLETDYYAAPVLWAVKKNITAGTSASTFSPGDTCSTAQILTFLWRAEGQPEPRIQNPFSDVQESDYFYKAALWAHEKGLVSGPLFGGNSPCTRAATVTYLWMLAGSPAAPSAAFTDVPSTADYAQAVAWAVSQSVTSGTSDTTFSPDDTCTRGQIVTFLYRAYEK